MWTSERATTFRWFRARLSAVASVLLLSVAVLGLPHEATPGHDADFGLGVVSHDASAHQMHAPSASAEGHPVHCLACHWARQFRPESSVGAMHGPAPDSELSRPLYLRVYTPAARASQPPLRSPPASPALT